MLWLLALQFFRVFSPCYEHVLSALLCACSLKNSLMVRKLLGTSREEEIL